MKCAIRDCFVNPKIFLLAIYSDYCICLAIQIFFAVPVLQFGLPFATWHTTILHLVTKQFILVNMYTIYSSGGVGPVVKISASPVQFPAWSRVECLGDLLSC